MQTASKKYKEIMDRMKRNRAYMSVYVGIVNQKAQENGAFTGVYAPWSNQSFPSGNGLYFENIATDKCGRLDGVVFQMPQDDEVN